MANKTTIDNARQTTPYEYPRIFNGAEDVKLSDSVPSEFTIEILNERPRKECPKCFKIMLTNHWARHQRSCRPNRNFSPLGDEYICPHCWKIQSNKHCHRARHEKRCKNRGDAGVKVVTPPHTCHLCGEIVGVRTKNHEETCRYLTIERPARLKLKELMIQERMRRGALTADEMRRALRSKPLGDEVIRLIETPLVDEWLTSMVTRLLDGDTLEQILAEDWALI